MWQAGVYSSVMHYLNAIKESGTDEPLKVAAKMREKPIEDFFARNGKLRDDNLMVHDLMLVQVKKPRRVQISVGLLQDPGEDFRRRRVRPARSGLSAGEEVTAQQSFRGGPKDQTSDVQLHIGESRDSGFARFHSRPGMTLHFTTPISRKYFITPGWISSGIRRRGNRVGRGGFAGLRQLLAECGLRRRAACAPADRRRRRAGRRATRMKLHEPIELIGAFWFG